MFISKYIAGETVPPYDYAITHAIEDYGIEGGGKELKIAVENLDGKVYRSITTVGMGALIHLTTALSDMGFHDPMANQAGTKEGYDCWFIPTDEVMELFPTVPEHGPQTDAASEILCEVDALKELTETERASIVMSRVGQGPFRDHLVKYWRGCAVTGATCIPLLKASHIKPWRDSTNAERLDVHNGLLLSPSLDAAFDAGYITFDQAGKIQLSNEIAGASAFQLHITAKLRINAKLLRPEHQAFLEHHRESVFLGRDQ